MKKIIISVLGAIVILVVFFVGCTKQIELKFDGNNYYQIQNGSMYAYDGQAWYQQISQEMPVASDVTAAEIWEKVGGNKNATYMRVLSTKNNTNLMPIFVSR